MVNVISGVSLCLAGFFLLNGALFLLDSQGKADSFVSHYRPKIFLKNQDASPQNRTRGDGITLSEVMCSNAKYSIELWAFTLLTSGIFVLVFSLLPNNPKKVSKALALFVSPILFSICQTTLNQQFSSGATLPLIGGLGVSLFIFISGNFVSSKYDKIRLKSNAINYFDAIFFVFLILIGSSLTFFPEYTASQIFQSESCSFVSSALKQAGSILLGFALVKIVAIGSKDLPFRKASCIALGVAFIVDGILHFSMIGNSSIYKRESSIASGVNYLLFGIISLYFGLTEKEYFKPPVITDKKHQ